MGARGNAAPGLQSTFADTWNIPLRRAPDSDIVVNQACADLFQKCSLIFQECAPESRMNKGESHGSHTVDGDPIADVSQLEHVRFVMKDGQVVRNDIVSH